jgi:hypothetical protein
LALKRLCGTRAEFLLAWPPARSLPGAETGKGTTRSQYTLLPFVSIYIKRAAGLALFYGGSFFMYLGIIAEIERVFFCVRG